MRQIVSLPNRDQAERFADHLRSHGIACTIDAGDDGYRLWVHDDDRVAFAKTELPAFLADPDHARYRDASRRAMARFQEDAARLKSARKKTVNLMDKWDRQSTNPCLVTYSLIGLSVIVAVCVGFMAKGNQQLLYWLWFSNDGTLRPVLRGELWRLVTPIFLHGDPMHLTFNMLMIYQLGMLIESRVGSLKFLGMVVAIAALSDLAQFEFHGPNFGGMSGVNYGLFGYCWIKGRLDPASGFALRQQAVTMMLVWFVLCWIGVIPGVANWVHGVGLATGAAMAFGETIVKWIMRRN